MFLILAIEFSMNKVDQYVSTSYMLRTLTGEQTCPCMLGTLLINKDESCIRQAATFVTEAHKQISLILYPRSMNIKKVKELIAVNGTPSHSYGVSLAICDHTVLPVTQHK